MAAEMLPMVIDMCCQCRNVRSFAKEQNLVPLKRDVLYTEISLSVCPPNSSHLGVELLGIIDFVS